MSLSAFPSTPACRLFTITWSARPLPPLPSPPSYPLSLVIFQSRHPPPTTTPLFLHPTRPAPLCSVRSPALFVQMEQKRKWKPESTVNPFLGLLLHYCVHSCCFPPRCFPRFDVDSYLYQEAAAMFVLFWWCCRGKKIACAEDSAKNKRKSQLLQIRLSEKSCTAFGDNNCGLLNAWDINARMTLLKKCCVR